MSICKDCLHNEVCKYGENRSNGMYCAGEKCKQYKPTADVVEVRHGYWVHNEDHNAYESEYFCSECSADGSSDIRGENYCYNCGAKMDGERIV